MAYRRAAIVALVAGAALVASIFVLMPSLALINASEPSRRIMALDSKAYYPDTENEKVTMNAVRPGDMKPNSFVWFLDPYGKTMGEIYDGSGASLTLDRKELERFEQRDAFEYYLLIRLPAWLGGEKDNAELANAVMTAMWLGRRAQAIKESGDKSAEQFFREAVLAAFETGRRSAITAP